MTTLNLESKRVSKTNRTFSIIGIIITSLLGFYAILETKFMGFPFGDYTDFDRLMKYQYYPKFLIIDSLFLLSFILGLIGINKKVVWSFALLIIMVLVHWQLTYYFYSHMNHGQGG